MKAEVILQNHVVNLEWNAPTVNVKQLDDGVTINIIGGVGPRGEDGRQGVDGEKGEDGYTPVRGVDYWTDEDKEEIVQATAEAIDLSGYARNDDVVMVPGTGVGSARTRDFEYNGQVISNEASGRGAFVEGNYNIASGNFTHAEGAQNVASGGGSHVEGQQCVSAGTRSHAEGMQTFSGGVAAHTEGGATMTMAQTAHAEGLNTFAAGNASHAEGLGSIYAITISGENTNYTYSEDVIISIGDHIKYGNFVYKILSVDDENKTFTTTLTDSLDNVRVYVFMRNAVGIGSHTEGENTKAYSNYQHAQGKYNIVDNQNVYADIVGNGENDTNRSNAFALSWEGDGKYAGDVYVGCKPDSSGGTKLAKITDIPEVPTKISDLTDDSGHYTKPVAGIPASDLEETYIKPTDIATSSTPGLVKVAGLGVKMDGDEIVLAPASARQLKQGVGDTAPIVAAKEREAVFYGLAKAAGDTTQAASANAVGAYTDEAKAAIRTMIDVPASSDIQDVPVQDVQINGTSILNNGVANVPIAGSGVLGAVKINNARGIGIFVDGTLSMAYASSDEIKGANTSFKPVTPAHEIEAAFYGLAYAAGAFDQQTSDNPVGQYTDNAKLAIRTMLGLDDTSIVDIVQAGLPAAEGVAW